MAKVQFKKRLLTNLIVVHCSATRATQDIGVRDIRLWHKAQGWLDVGYHFVIRRDGTIEEGRPVDAVGSHVSGRNSESVGVCLVGGIDSKGKPESNYTEAQWSSLEEIVGKLVELYPKASVTGHTDLDSGKACPCFSVLDWWYGADR